MNIQEVEDLEVDELFNLSVEDRKKVIDVGVDLLFQQIMITSQMNDIKPSVLMNGTLHSIEQQIKEHKENDNFELCYYFTEVFWETNKRLDNLRKKNEYV